MVATRLHVECESLGDPVHPAIVLVMGLGMQLLGWSDDSCQELVARSYRVIRFNNRESSPAIGASCHGTRS